ncbi:MAG: MATE family efflux transporter, partial [Bacteroidales bacterium]
RSYFKSKEKQDTYIQFMTEKTPISYRHIFGIAFPIILSSMAQNVIALADTVFLGNIGEAELAAAALASVFYSVLVMLMTGFGIGTQIIIARKLGESQSRSIGRIFQH